MSILSAADPLNFIAAVPSSAPVVESGGALAFWACVAWAAVGLLIVYAFGGFRRRSIVGPDRLLPGQAPVDLLIIFAVAFFAMIAAAGMTNHLHLGADAKMLALNGAANAGACIAIVLALLLFRPGQLARLGTSPRWIPAGIAGGAATLFVLYPQITLSGAAVELVYRLLHRGTPEAHELLKLLSDSHNRVLSIATIGLAVVGAPLTEELMYRALLQTALGHAFASLSKFAADPTAQMPESGQTVLNYRSAVFSSMSPGPAPRWAAVVITAAIFAAIHLNIAFFFPIFVLALGLGYIYERTGNLWVTIFAHGLFNGGQILVYLASGH